MQVTKLRTEVYRQTSGSQPREVLQWQDGSSEMQRENEELRLGLKAAEAAAAEERQRLSLEASQSRLLSRAREKQVRFRGFVVLAVKGRVWCLHCQAGRVTSELGFWGCDVSRSGSFEHRVEVETIAAIKNGGGWQVVF